MTTKNEKKQLKPYQGILVFILFLLVAPFISIFIPQEWGLYGTILVQLTVLLFGVIPAIILKADLREVFPIKKPLFRQIFGVIFIWIGSLLASTLGVLIIGIFFPEGLMDVNDQLYDMFTSVPMWIAFIIISIMPAICEEALHRGFILSSLAPIKNKWIKILIMGAIFGAFHLDPYRFLPTAILGMGMTYIMLETKNIILPALFHFINNALVMLISFTVRPEVELPVIDLEIMPDMMKIALGSYLLLGSVIPWVFLLGSKLIHKKDSLNNREDIIEKEKKGNKQIISAMIISAFMILGGLIIVGLNANEILLDMDLIN